MREWENERMSVCACVRALWCAFVCACMCVCACACACVCLYKSLCVCKQTNIPTRKHCHMLTLNLGCLLQCSPTSSVCMMWPCDIDSLSPIHTGVDASDRVRDSVWQRLTLEGRETCRGRCLCRYTQGSMPLSGQRLTPAYTLRLIPLNGQRVTPAYTQGSMPQSGQRLTPACTQWSMPV